MSKPRRATPAKELTPTAPSPLTGAGAFLAPYLPADPALHPAWFGCLHWALTDPDILAAFRADTGMAWTPGKTPIARMIDEATGMERAFFTAFAQWLNEHIWGEV